MKKLDSIRDKETPQEELKRLRKENKIPLPICIVEEGDYQDSKDNAYSFYGDGYVQSLRREGPTDVYMAVNL